MHFLNIQMYLATQVQSRLAFSTLNAGKISIRFYTEEEKEESIHCSLLVQSLQNIHTRPISVHRRFSRLFSLIDTSGYHNGTVPALCSRATDVVVVTASYVRSRSRRV